MGQNHLSHFHHLHYMRMELGMLMMVIGNFKGAIESFEKALEINPTHSRVRCKLALCFYECDEKELAMSKLIETEPMNTEIVNLHYQTAILFCDKEKFASALFNLENTMKENYTQPDASTNIEVVLENLGLVDRAIATWDRLTETAKTAISERYE